MCKHLKTVRSDHQRSISYYYLKITMLKSGLLFLSHIVCMDKAGTFATRNI
jgi:hypothetical protein